MAETIEVIIPPEVVEVLEGDAQETVVVIETQPAEVVEVESTIEVNEIEPLTEVVEVQGDVTTVEVTEVENPEVIDVGGGTISLQPRNTFITAADPGNHLEPILWVKLNPEIPGDISLVLRVP